MLRELLADKRFRNRLILFIVAIFYLGAYFYHKREKDNIQENLSITTCKIIDVDSGYRGGIQMTYSFSYNGKVYTAGRKYLISYAYADRFLGYSFPVAFNKENPSQHNILLLPDDFDEFSLVFPDSLEWVRSLKEKSL